MLRASPPLCHFSSRKKVPGVSGDQRRVPRHGDAAEGLGGVEHPRLRVGDVREGGDGNPELPDGRVAAQVPGGGLGLDRVGGGCGHELGGGTLQQLLGGGDEGADEASIAVDHAANLPTALN